MSNYQFFASDKPLKEVENKKIELLSAKEAIARNFEIDNDFIEDFDLENDEKVILVAQDEEDLYEIEIAVEDDPCSARDYTKKPYIATLSWRYSEGRAQELIAYIKEHLETAENLEIWDTWLDEVETPIIKKCSLSSFSTADIKNILGQDGFQAPKCLIVEK